MWPLYSNHLSQLSSMKTVQFSLVILWHTPGSAVVQRYTFTSASYSPILVVSFVFQFSFQMLFFARATVANSFLPWMSSQSPSFDPSFITFLYFLSLLLVRFSRWYIRSFLRSLTGFCFSLFLLLSHRSCPFLFYLCDKVTISSRMLLFNPSGIYVSATYWFFLHLILYQLERSAEVQCEEWIINTASLRWSDVRFKSGCLGIFRFNLKGGLC